MVNSFVFKAPVACCLHTVAILPNPQPLCITMVKFCNIRGYLETRTKQNKMKVYVTSACLPEMQLKVRQL